MQVSYEKSIAKEQFYRNLCVLRVFVFFVINRSIAHHPSSLLGLLTATSIGV